VAFGAPIDLGQVDRPEVGSHGANVGTPGPELVGKRQRTRSQVAKGSAAKGAQAERDVLGAFRDVMRNVEEDLKAEGFEFVARSGFATRKRLEAGTSNRDLGNIPLISIEVKRREQLAIKDWWAQAERQADKGELPVLIYRQNKEAWRVRTWLAFTDPYARPVQWVQAETSLPDFLAYYANLYRAFLLEVLS
jgi:hypothetical protein